MTALTNTQIGILTGPIAEAFGQAKARFWAACREAVDDIRNQVAEGPFQQEVDAALVFLNLNEEVVPLLGRLVIARPGHRALREAVRKVAPDALAGVSDLRFEVEEQIEATLNSDQARALRASLAEIDVLMKAVTAYKAMHDALHVLQPLVQLLRGAAAVQARWPEMRLSLVPVKQQLAQIDNAVIELRALGRNQRLQFRTDIDNSLRDLDAALNAKLDYEVRDCASQLTSDVEDGLETVDVMMLAAAEQAIEPVGLAVDFLNPLMAGASDTPFGNLVRSYVDFARQISGELADTIEEHGRWQQLDRRFDLLQRVVVENQPAGTGEIDTVWRLAYRQLDSLCCEVPPPAWAAGIVALLDAAKQELKPPISPPVGEQARDQISALISSGRNRFMEVDRALLEWLLRSASRQPELISLLKGDEHAAAR